MKHGIGTRTRGVKGVTSAALLCGVLLLSVGGENVALGSDPVGIFPWNGSIGIEPLGAPSGNPSTPGGASFDGTVYTVTGSGGDVWGSVDRCHLIAKAETGNFAIEATVDWIDPGTHNWSKAGLMVRRFLEGSSAMALVGIRNPANPGVGGDVFTSFRRGDASSAFTPWPAAEGLAPARLRLVRVANRLTGYYLDGTAWRLAAPPQVLTGLSGEDVALCLFVTSHQDNGSGVPPGTVEATATFENVTISPWLEPVPVAPGNLTAVASPPNVILQWTDTANEDGFRVERSINGGEFVEIAVLYGTVDSYVDTVVGYPPVAQYSYRVRAFNATGESAYSDIAGTTIETGPVGEFTWNGNLGIAPAGIPPGNPSTPGGASFANGQYTVTGSGADVWDTVDRCHLVGKSLTGDFAMDATIDWINPGINLWCKAGLMVRQGYTASSPMSFVGIRDTAQMGGNVIYQWRDNEGDRADWTGPAAAGLAPVRVRLVRVGNRFTGYYLDGAAWRPAGSPHVVPGITGDEVTAWLFVTSHQDNGSGVAPGTVEATATFANVDISPFAEPPPPAAPSGLTAAGIYPDTIVLQWTGSGSTADGYVVERSVNGVDFGQIAVACIDTYTDRFYFPGEIFFYRVRAFNATGDSEYSNVASIASTVLEGVYAFQQGVWPDAAYDGCEDASIEMYGGAAPPGSLNNGANIHFEEGDWQGIEDPGHIPPSQNAGFIDNKLILVKFDISAIPAGSAILEADLRMFYDYERRANTPPVDHYTWGHMLKKLWNEGTGTGIDGRQAQLGEVCLNSARYGEENWEVAGARGVSDIWPPGEFQSVSETMYGSVEDIWVEWDLTAMAQFWVDNPGLNHGVKISQDDLGYGTSGYHVGCYNFRSSEYPFVATRPILFVHVGNTPEGTSVEADVGEGVAVTFDVVSGAGNTAATRSPDPPPGAPTSSAFQVQGEYLEITTTAEYSGGIALAIAYDDTGLTPQEEEALALLHYDEVLEEWVDITTSVDTVNNVVYGYSDTLSVFAVVLQRLAPTMVPPLHDGTSIDAPDGPFKRGRTIPVKFRLLNLDGQVISDAEAMALTPTLRIFDMVPGIGGTPIDPGDSPPDTGGEFRYDAKDDLFIYNLSTKHAAWLADYTYGLAIRIDGFKVGSFYFSLR